MRINGITRVVDSFFFFFLAFGGAVHTAISMTVAVDPAPWPLLVLTSFLNMIPLAFPPIL